MEEKKNKKEFPTVNNIEVSAILYSLEVATKDIAVPIEALASAAIATLLVAEDGDRTGEDLRFSAIRVSELFVHSINEITRHLSDKMELSIPSKEENEDLQ